MVWLDVRWYCSAGGFPICHFSQAGISCLAALDSCMIYSKVRDGCRLCWDSAVSHRWMRSEELEDRVYSSEKGSGVWKVVTFSACSHLVLLCCPLWRKVTGIQESKQALAGHPRGPLLPCKSKSPVTSERCHILVVQKMFVNSDIQNINPTLSQTGLRTFKFGCSLIWPCSKLGCTSFMVLFSRFVSNNSDPKWLQSGKQRNYNRYVSVLWLY